MFPRPFDDGGSGNGNARRLRRTLGRTEDNRLLLLLRVGTRGSLLFLTLLRCCPRCTPSRLFLPSHHHQLPLHSKRTTRWRRRTSHDKEGDELVPSHHHQINPTLSLPTEPPSPRSVISQLGSDQTPSVAPPLPTSPSPTTSPSLRPTHSSASSTCPPSHNQPDHPASSPTLPLPRSTLSTPLSHTPFPLPSHTILPLGIFSLLLLTHDYLSPCLESVQRCRNRPHLISNSSLV